MGTNWKNMLLFTGNGMTVLQIWNTMNVTLFSKSAYFTAHIKINYQTGCIGSFSGKYRDVSRSIAIAKVEFFVALVSSLQPLTSFTMSPSRGAMSILNSPLEYYNVI